MKINYRLCLIFSLVFFLIGGRSFSFDWIDLHEKAASLTVGDAEKIYAESQGEIQSLYLAGLAYLENYQAILAEKVFREITEIDSNNDKALWGKVEVLRRLHRCQDCQSVLEAVIERNPAFAPAYITLAYINYKNMEFDRASRLAYQVIRMGEGNVDTTNYVRALGLFAGAKGMLAHYGGPISKIINGRMVMPYLQRAKRVDPDSAVVYFGLGSYYLLAPAVFGRDLSKAKEYLKKAVEADPLFADIYVRLAQAYQAEGNQKKYTLNIEKALGLDPKNELALDITEGVCNFICLGR